MAAIEVITGFTIAPSATQTAVTMATGDSLAVKNFNAPNRAFLISMWTKHQVAGTSRIRSAKMHDFVQGFNALAPINSPLPVFPGGTLQPLEAQDNLVVEMTGSAVAGDIETHSHLIYYESLPGSDARFIDEARLDQRGKNVINVQVSCVTGVTGGYSGQVALSAAATGDLLKANTDYAILGATPQANVCTIGIRGTDTGNVRLGVPGSAFDQWLTNQWFLYLTRLFQVPMIPVINSANKGGTFIDVAKDENALTVLVSLTLQELSAA